MLKKCSVANFYAAMIVGDVIDSLFSVHSHVCTSGIILEGDLEELAQSLLLIGSFTNMLQVFTNEKSTCGDNHEGMIFSCLYF